MSANPLLRTRPVAGGIRLELGGWSYGNGRTVQEAADDLVARVIRQATALRRDGLRFTSELPPPDRDLLDFLWEVADLAARGEDVRSLVFRPADRG
jgi:hypothetical protein